MAVLFPLGQLIITERAAALLKELHINPVTLLLRHLAGDWGEGSFAQRWANDLAVYEGGRILSEYGHGQKRVCVLTELDRTITTVLLPPK
ncbi:MAG TPA: hypothetical protein VKI19_03405 [Acidimicrobiales bacterium]|nr:hypothetical protein [Acidimicrobiales bacterium]